MSPPKEEPERPEYKALLAQDVNLRRWFQNNAKGSQIVAEVYLRRLGSFCAQNRMSPGAYAKLPKRKMEEIAFDFVQDMEAKVNPKSGQKYAPSYVDSNLKAILSWARWNRKRFEMRIRVADSSKRPTLENERVPTNDELRKVLYADTTPLRTRAEIAIMAFAGCRPEVQGNYQGLDGLKIKDFRELVIEDGKVRFTAMPALIVIRSELSKSRHWYPTFMLAEGCEIIKQHLERRLAEGEELSPASGIITSSARSQEKLRNLKVINDASPFLRTTKIGLDIRKAMRASGLPWRPYVFRSYFDTALLLGESKGFVSHAYQQCWMGHKGSIEATYTLRKGELPAELLNDMRSAYGRVAEGLGTTKKEAKVDPRESLITVIMVKEGKSRKEAEEMLQIYERFQERAGKKVEFMEVTEEDIVKVIELTNEGAKGASGRLETDSLAPTSEPQKVVAVEEVEQLLGDGWEFVANLPNGKVIVRK